MAWPRYDGGMDSVDQLIASLQLSPHPEGGHYRRIHESDVQVQGNGIARPALTAIHYLLARGERSRWHRVDADEAWHWQDGDALALQEFDAETGELSTVTLDSVARGGIAMHVVRAGRWQSARPLGGWTLVACTVSPGFVWEGFELLAGDSEVARALLSRGGTLD